MAGSVRLSAEVAFLANIETPFSDPATRLEAGRMGMAILLISLAMLFAAALLGLSLIHI